MRAIGFICVLISICLGACNSEEKEKDLKGTWTFKIDSLDKGLEDKWFKQSFTEKINLPGSLAENGKGRKVDAYSQWTGNIRNPNWMNDPNYKPYLDSSEFLFPYWLIPDFHNYGPVWYQKEIFIPEEWKNDDAELLLERCHWESMVWFNDSYVGSCNRLGTPHVYDLTEFLKPGKHKLTIRMDNRTKEVDVGKDSHSISDHTQGNWNGIVGKMKIINKPKIRISEISLHSYPEDKEIKLCMKIVKPERKNTKLHLSLKIHNYSDNDLIEEFLDSSFVMEDETEEIIIRKAYRTKLETWDEFNPALYRMQVQLISDAGISEKEIQFGIRKFEVRDKQFAVNGKKVFLRGTLECAIFPKTAYPAMQKEEWLRIFQVIKNHGLNHMRFHSWCPPEAAFQAADESGIYLQVECSSWANSGSTLGDGLPIDKWLYEESRAIVREYGNHPSFCLMAYGNEPAGRNQRKYLADFVNYWKNKDPRRVYTSGAGWPAIEESDYHNLPGPRIQGWGEQLKSIINGYPPASNYDWKEKISSYDKPVVSHEIGQWCVYPNLKEKEKYTGVLKAKNFEIFERSLKAHHLEHLADSIHLASGKLQALCYKAEIEAALRTKDFAGFQLLDLHDFPGQGTALVGVLDPFWDQKAYISAEEFKAFCNHTVPLARFDKRIFSSRDSIHIPLELALFADDAKQDIRIKWKICNRENIMFYEGEFTQKYPERGNGIVLDTIHTLIEVEQAEMLSLEVCAEQYCNSWDFWVYPENHEILKGEVYLTEEMNEKAEETLRNGGSVLWSIPTGKLKNEMGGDVGIGFSSIFWNTAWTGGQKPHTLGILCNPKHPALDHFPSDYHSNWQWWDAMSHSSPLMLDSIQSDLKPIVRVIDDWVTNRSLGLIVELNAGNGKLLISGIDLLQNREKRLEARQLLNSLLEYMNSESFKPTTMVDLAKVKALVY